MIERSTKVLVRSDYDVVAAEYYDVRRHPTCSNFSELSSRFLSSRILGSPRSELRILEVGAGRSTAAPVLADAGCSLEFLTLLDKSAAMLAHSVNWRERSVRTFIADACSTSLPTASYDLVVASLCDPFNRIHFWQEAQRVLAVGGLCLATIPAYEWVTAFREKSAADIAEFELSDGQIVGVPSFVPTLDCQLAMIEKAGLIAKEVVTFTTLDLTGPVSPKLNVHSTRRPAPVLRGLTILKH
jgi:SAM-dependent methyltransferase